MELRFKILIIVVLLTVVVIVQTLQINGIKNSLAERKGNLVQERNQNDGINCDTCFDMRQKNQNKIVVGF